MVDEDAVEERGWRRRGVRGEVLVADAVPQTGRSTWLCVLVNAVAVKQVAPKKEASTSGVNVFIVVWGYCSETWILVLSVSRCGARWCLLWMQSVFSEYASLVPLYPFWLSNPTWVVGCTVKDEACRQQRIARTTAVAAWWCIESLNNTSLFGQTSAPTRHGTKFWSRILRSSFTHIL